MMPAASYLRTLPVLTQFDLSHVSMPSIRAVRTFSSSPEALARGRPRCLLVYSMGGGVVSSLSKACALSSRLDGCYAFAPYPGVRSCWTRIKVPRWRIAIIVIIA